LGCYRAIAFPTMPKLKEKHERADLVATQLACIMKTMTALALTTPAKVANILSRHWPAV
jgi:hypothetical protein